MALGGQAGVLHDDHRCVAGQALQQCALNARCTTDAHVNHQREFGLAGGVRQCHPVGATVAGFGVAGDEHHAMGVFAVGEWHVETAHRGQSSGNAIDDVDFNARRVQCFYFFAAPAEHKGVTSFEPHDVLALTRLADHEFFDKGLGRGCTAAALADIDDACLGLGVAQHRFVDQIVHQQDAGAGDGFDRFECEQFRVAGPCADQGDFAHGLGRW